jgi:hypothetical protein
MPWNMVLYVLKHARKVYMLKTCLKNVENDLYILKHAKNMLQKPYIISSTLTRDDLFWNLMGRKYVFWNIVETCLEGLYYVL